MINLKITKLEKSYSQPLLENVTLNHTSNGIVALIGDNGSGKTTLLKIIADLEEQESGRIEWTGEPRIGYLQQEIDFLPTLSGGQKKIALLADLIYSGLYDVLLLDEPDNHLDIENKQWLASAMQAFDGLIIMISHDRHLLKQITTHTWLVEDGSIRTYPFGYEKFVLEIIGNKNANNVKNSGQKIIIDPNGGAGAIAKNILKQLNVDAVGVNMAYGEFSRAIEPNEDSLFYLKNAIDERNADFAAGFDCDADRVEIITGKGMVSGNNLLALVADEILKHSKNKACKDNDYDQRHILNQILRQADFRKNGRKIHYCFLI